MKKKIRDNTKINPTLVDLNKKFILLILKFIKENYAQANKPSKITIYNEEPKKELITYEEIQNEKKGQFEKDFIKRQEEFESFMTIKPPPVPEFIDKKKDEPIKDMEQILKEMKSQRNYEVEQINTSSSNLNKEQINNWLKPQETSLKNEKLNSSQLNYKLTNT